MKKSWRKIIVDGVEYAWCLPGDDAYVESCIIVHGKGASNFQSLHIDATPWEIEIRPKTVKEAIIYSLNNGWNPNKKGSGLYLGYLNDKFIVLPEDIRRTHLLKSPFINNL